MDDNEPISLEIKDAKDVDRLMERLGTVAGKVADAVATRDAAKAAADIEFADVATPLQEEMEQIKSALAKYLLSRRTSWLRRFGKTAHFVGGIVKWRIIPAKIVIPKVDQLIIDALLDIRGGKKYLRVKHELDRDALKNVSPAVLAKLRHLGVKVTRQEALSVIVSDDEGKSRTIQLDQSPYPRNRK